MNRYEDITNFTEHRQHLREHLSRVRETGRPLYITTNGQPEAVVLSAEAYDALVDRAELAETLAMIRRSEADAAAGRAQLARETMAALHVKLGEITPSFDFMHTSDVVDMWRHATQPTLSISDVRNVPGAAPPPSRLRYCLRLLVEHS
ncbi:MAG: type II toxin-antitoxin system Phd/YefM family antitoxin [bacterium]|jgi:prevent-host-death family protein|nr:type II toxin-antitoxin system Phd/YefM family antitoxin [Phycisphaerales bacterium]